MNKLLLLAFFVSSFAFSEELHHCEDEAGNMTTQESACSPSIEPSTSPQIREGSISKYSIWVEPNYVDTHYSALLQSQQVTRGDKKYYQYISFGWIPYIVKAEVTDVFKGDLKKGEVIEILIYVSSMSKFQKDIIKGEFILSFCKSKGGVYFNSRDFLIQEPTLGNVTKFIDVRTNGTDYKASEDCQGYHRSLNPDNHN
ncbi:hypothetical protein K6Y31_16230 [Motilimonas cestriensis]|uniref:Uncharacterized protein n=1 Tax=Motilimonas cestriensis TaxID=2742685 RepID=A0ABS8WBG7_9GAMM|nr:hypothetical protein [Motilimonas cestriensis]MCE2596349.1 hypothetical protein [Motilimonas cestriensis]